METDREEITRKAILEKLSAGFDLFTADDILTVAGITNQQLEEIRRGIRVKPSENGERS